MFANFSLFPWNSKRTGHKRTAGDGSVHSLDWPSFLRHVFTVSPSLSEITSSVTFEPGCMAEEELEALRARRLAELQAQYGEVSDIEG